MAGEDWSREEIEAAVSDYLDMMATELRGEPVNKAEHNRLLRNILTLRSKGSVEFKHQNISAVLIELGYPYITGYKPRRNYQDLLAQVVEERVSEAGKHGLNLVVEQAVSAPASLEPPGRPDDLLAIEGDAPEAPEQYEHVRESTERHRLLIHRNYLEMEARNHSLGLAGEHLILAFEHERLWRSGAKHLAERIEHVAQTKGDGMGYDIRSFELNGADRLIEVKTTRFGEMTPFFVTANEVNVSKRQAEEYHLYRLFSFADRPRLFRLQGSLEKTCTLQASQFSATAWRR